jgi:hypothetical protein
MFYNYYLKYFKVKNEHKIFRSDAEAKCQSFGTDSHLASCLTEKELMYIAYQNLDSANAFFIGVSDV